MPVCSGFSTARCQNMTTPPSTITAVSTSGIVIPCHSANSSCSLPGKRTSRYSLNAVDSSTGKMPHTTVSVVSTVGEIHKVGPIGCMSRTAFDSALWCAGFVAKADHQKYSE